MNLILTLQRKELKKKNQRCPENYFEVLRKCLKL